MSKDFIFTRYLYEKEEVELALTFALLNKKEEEALFWAYELYYSGFQTDLIQLLWDIYYQFYASMNPAFYVYLLKKTTHIEEFEKDSRILGCIINNLLTRPFNLDTFTLRQMYVDKNDIIENIFKGTTDKGTTDKGINFELLKLFDFTQTDKKLFDQFVNYFELDNTKMKKIIYNKNIPVDTKTILISYILYHYGEKMNKRMGKKIYVQTMPEELVIYETIQVNLNCKEENKLIPILPAYKILPLVCLFPINGSQYLHLFKLKRETQDIRQAYLNDWVKYVVNTPIWIKRMEEFEEEEDYYQNFNYEPDEQKKETQDKSIQDIYNSNSDKKTWNNFYEDFNKNSFLE